MFDTHYYVFVALYAFRKSIAGANWAIPLFEDSSALKNVQMPNRKTVMHLKIFH